MGTYADPNFTFLRTLRPSDNASAQDLTQATTTVIGSFIIPSMDAQYLMRRIGFVVVNIGTSVTVPAQAQLKLVGPGAAAATTYLTIQGTLSTTQTVTTQNTALAVAAYTIIHPGSTCIAYQTVEVDLNQVTGTSPLASTSGVSPTDTLNATPLYPVWPVGCVAQLTITTQGVGGTQTAYPYMIVQRDAMYPT